MANKKVSQLDPIDAVSAADLLYVVDVSDTTDGAAGTSKHVTVSNLGVSGSSVWGGITGTLSDQTDLQTALNIAGGLDRIDVSAFGAVGDGDSHPLSEFYGTLGEAQAVYPHATALTDEIDWCAWQAASNYIYDRDYAANGGAGTSNWSGGTIYAKGNYVINKTVVFNHLGIRIIGDMSAFRNSLPGTTSIEYNGTAGTEDAPVYMFDFYTTTEDGSAPPGRVGNATVSGTKVVVDFMTFTGNNGAMGTEGSHNYVSAILLRRSNFAQFRNCNIGNGVYDGIVVRGPALWLTIEMCNFYKCNRDCIGVWNVGGQGGSFSTTIWIRDNEFGYYGRYAILMDLSGSVEPMPVVSNNSIEGSDANTFYWQNPEHFVHGVISSFCYINAGNMVDEDNRFEGTAQSAGIWGDYHLINTYFATISKSTGTNIVLSSHSNTQARSDDAITYATANVYLDITDQRNYRLGDVGDIANYTYNLTLKKINTLCSITCVGDNILGTTGYHNFEDVDFYTWVIPTKAAVAREGKVVQEVAEAIPLPIDWQAISVMRNVGVRPLFHAFNYQGKVTLASGTGDIRCIGPSTNIADWAATTAYNATFDPSNRTESGQKRVLVQPTTNNGYIYQCTTAGTSGGSEPTWPTTIGNTVADGTVTWTCRQQVYYDSDNLAYEQYVLGNKRQRSGTAAPTVGRWKVGDKIIDANPTAAGTIGWVCTTAGEPGTWKTFGAIGA